MQAIMGFEIGQQTIGYYYRMRLGGPANLMIRSCNYKLNRCIVYNIHGSAARYTSDYYQFSSVPIGVTERRGRSLISISGKTYKGTAQLAGCLNIVDTHRQKDITMVKNADFEYHFTFPDGNNKEVDGKAIPVVVLLGWFSCSDKHLSKYSAIYDNLGYITMRFITSPKLLLYRPQQYGSVASRLLDILRNSDLQDHPLFFHTFSNGGTYIYDHVARHLSKDKDTERFKLMGCTFDSAPAVTSLTNLYRAVHTSTPGGEFRKALMGSMLVIYAALYIWYHTIKYYINGMSFKPPSLEMYESLVGDPHRHPQLFLYSKSDNINEHKFVESFAEQRKSLGVKVFEKCWLDSPHVLHYPNHKEEYVEAVKNFIGYCLKEQSTLQRETNGDLANGFHYSEHKQDKK